MVFLDKYSLAQGRKDCSSLGSNGFSAGEDRFFSKIDRVLANQSWLDAYQTAEVLYLNEGTFDHSPGLLTIHPSMDSRKKPLRYFRMSQSHKDFVSKLKGIWEIQYSGTMMYQLLCRLKEMKKREELNYQSFLQQKAQINWIKAGDDNTAIFHASIKGRRRKNRILSIEETDCTRVHEPGKIISAFLDYYTDLLGSSMQNRKNVIASVMDMGPTFTAQQVEFLSTHFTCEEVKQAVLDIPGIKAPSLDGFASFFFQDNLEIVGPVVCDVVLSFLETWKILKETNSAVLTLVPKVKCPNTVKDFRPIACCNVIYKDLLRHYGRKANKPSCMIKLDLQKAFDTIEWGFIEENLVAFKFPNQFTQLVMKCIKTPKFSLMFNGALHGFFASQRGLRKGDPMSPLLFVLGMEYMSRIMKKIGKKTGFKYHDKCEKMKLNHLSFDDDVLLFCLKTIAV
uniref:Reverse transcriptase domain-containing protein n=1 Tax=Cannabis sativa TaxID=3483 RepID=A0A803PRH6_CANSA